MTPKDKVYSPDLQPYSFEGRSGIFGTLLAFAVAPVRVVTRVVHNVFIMPANMLGDYAKSLLLVSCVLLGLGVLDMIMFGKWPLLVSQVPALYYALRLKAQSAKSVQAAMTKREVDIDTSQVEELCSSIYDELNEVIK